MAYTMPDGLNKIIAVDFDGVLCEEKWPEIGEENTEIIEYILYEQKKGAKLILWTLRCGQRLDEAIAWCKERGIIFDAVNENMPEPVQKFRSESRKIFAHEYIDDRNNTRFNLPFRSKNEKHMYSIEIDVEYEPVDDEPVSKHYRFEGKDYLKLKQGINDVISSDEKRILPNGGSVTIDTTTEKDGEWFDSDSETWFVTVDKNA